MKQLAPGVLVIGRYEPTVYNPWVIGQDLLRISENMNLKTIFIGYWPMATWGDFDSGSELRSPDSHTYIRENGQSLEWHQDNQGRPHAMVLWSNREQTEIMLLGGDIIYPAPYDVLLISNTMVKHRTPPMLSEDRWFFRRAVVEPDWMAK